MGKKSFSEAVQQRIGNYVYRLIDPRNGETFYVGQGIGNRVFAHANNTLTKKSNEPEDDFDLKTEKIREILNENLEVIHVIHRHNIPKVALDEVEAALIDAYPGLTNSQGGIGSGDHGPMNSDQLEVKYALPALEENPPHKLMLINVNSIRDRSNATAILDQVRFAWPAKEERANQAEYILAVIRGVVIGAFTPTSKWLPATRKNFPELDKPSEPNRKAFHGEKAPDEIWERYVGEQGKRVTNPKMKNFRNPLRYWNIP